MIGLIIIVVAVVVVWGVYSGTRKPKTEYMLPANTHQLLQDNVRFYEQLNPADQKIFETRIKDFLANTSIRGIDVEVDDLDRLLIASGAIILIISFPDWRYNNLSEVLLYKGNFNENFQTDGEGRNVLGMVGDGAMRRQMVLSKPSLRSSFQRDADGHNTVIHEFAHLIDKADGAVDGVPDYLLSKTEVLPWIAEVRDTIKEMRAKGHSDIDFYGATNDAEFFAVISEYFFERPEKLKDHHPELYAMLNGMFHQKEGSE